jgi:DNA-binding response OmpR family regulator
MERRPLILAIDDEANILKLIKANLTAEGYDVITASGGLEALEILEDKQPDLVLLDIMMPGIDGYETIKLIRRQSEVPIIMLTAKDDMRSLEEAMSSGADDYLTKPFNIRQLSARVRAKLRRTSFNPEE